MDSQGYDKVYESNKEWWKDYWSKSYVYLPSQPDFEKRRTYYMYLAGISNRGNYHSNTMAATGLLKVTGVTGATGIGTGIRTACINRLIPQTIWS